MKHLRLSLFIALPVILATSGRLFATGGLSSEAASQAQQSPQVFVILHGAWGGGWAFKGIERSLRADGHTVYRPTLTGQGERVHLANPDIDLNVHIQDVVNVILWEDLKDIVLVGHSYGGMVITGVADRVPERIKHVVYLDAFLPEDGESAATALDRVRELKVTDGFVVPAWIKDGMPLPHDVPHPAKTLTQPIALKNQPAARKIPTTYILTVDPGKKPEEDGFFKFSERARLRGWPVTTVEADHNIQWSRPERLIELLEEIP